MKPVVNVIISHLYGKHKCFDMNNVTVQRSLGMSSFCAGKPFERFPQGLRKTGFISFVFITCIPSDFFEGLKFHLLGVSSVAERSMNEKSHNGELVF